MFNFLSLVKMRVSPYLEKGVVKNQTKYIGENTTIPCYELISGTIPGTVLEFQWLKWKSTPNFKIVDRLIENNQEFGNMNKSMIEFVQADKSRQIVKETRRVNTRSLIYGVELVLTNLTKNDSGFYTCLVSNLIGSDYANMYLDVKHKPGTVSEVKTMTSHIY